MMSDMITVDDVLRFESYASKVPAFVLERMAKRKSNLVSKFESQIRPRLETLGDANREKLEVVLNSEVSDLQAVLNEAYEKSGKKQFKILANPKYAEFIEQNLDEVRKMIH